MRGQSSFCSLLSSMEMKHTYDAIQRCPELMRDHRQKLFLGLHADLQVLDLLQSVAHQISLDRT
jgi:hypothetical protein